LSFGNGALEIPVGKRVVLNFNRKPLIARVNGGPPGYRPRLKYTIELETQVIVQAAGGVLLDHKAQAI